MDFDLYAPAPLPPKPKARAPKIFQIDWYRAKDGTFYGWTTAGFRRHWNFHNIKPLMALGIATDGRGRVTYTAEAMPKEWSERKFENFNPGVAWTESAPAGDR